MSTSKVKGQGHQGQKRAVHSHHPAAANEWFVLLHAALKLARCKQHHAANGTIPLPPGGGVISAACVWLMCGKTSLALIFFGRPA